MNDTKVLGEFYFSQLLEKPIYDSDGHLVGRVKDMAACWDGIYPQIVGIKYAKKVHELIPVDKIQSCDGKAIKLVPGFSLKQTVILRENDIYIRKWLLDKQIIDLKGSRMVRVNDIILSFLTQDNSRQVVLLAVDVGVRGLFRRLGLEFFFKGFKDNLLGMQYIKPLENWNSSLQLTREKKQLSELHPADIADLLEDMDYKNRVSFMENLDTQQAIDALAELDLDTQVEIIEQMDEKRASDILEDMPPDEAADILGELPTEKSEELLNLMEIDEAVEMRELMKYEEGTAGALMTTEYIAFDSQITADQAINKLRELAPNAETIYYLYVTDEEEHLLGVLSLRELIVAAPQTVLSNLMHSKVASVKDSDDDQRVAEVIRKYGLLALPVVDEENVMLGIVTVDDVLYMLMPERSKLDFYSWFAFSKLPGRGR